MRIAHVIYRFGVGGMENGIVNLVNQLPEDKFEHAIICLTTSSRFAERIHTGNCSVYELYKRDGKDLSVYLRLWRLLRKLRPHVLHTRNLGTVDLAPVGRFAGVPVRVHGEHGWDAQDPHGESAKYRRLRKICDFFVSEYVAVSKDIADWLARTINTPQSRINQIYNGVDTIEFSPNGTVARLPFGDCDVDRLVIGAVGRLDSIKNFDVLIEAVHRIVTSGPALAARVRLIVVGDGAMRGSYMAQVDRLGLKKITWMAGERDDIADILRAIDIFVLPSRNEGISNTILEAMATGLPVIASDVGGNKELIVNAESGSLVKADDVDALAHAICDYANDTETRRRHGLFARQRAEKIFSLDEMVQSYARLYDRLLEKHRPTRTT